MITRDSCSTRSIAGLVCALASLVIVSSHAADAPDIIYTNGNIITVDDTNSVAEALAVKGDKIQMVGHTKEIEVLADSHTRIVDLAGKTMIPGIIDPHSHFPLSASAELFVVDLNSPPIGKIQSMDDIIAALKKKAGTVPKGQWIIGLGYDDSLIKEKRHPVRDDLDQVSTDHPVFIMHLSYHFGVANSKALQLAKITKDTPDPAGGKIRRDASHQPTGVLEELSAYELVLEKIPPYTREQYLQLISYAGKQYAAQGVTTAQHGYLADRPGLLSDPDLLPAFEQAIKEKTLPIRLIVWPGLKYSQMLASGKAKPPSLDSGWLKIGATKMFDDGSIQGYTGYLGMPYYVQASGHDKNYRGYPTMPREKLTELVMAEHKAGKQIAIHGNGDAAIDDILYAFEQAQKAAPRPDARHMIVHAQTAREDQLDKMKALGVSPTFFVLHTYYWGDRHRDIFLGPQRATHISPLNSALKRELRFTIHTDTPVVPMEPFRLIWSAVNRLTTSGKVLGEEERITPIQALRAVTIDAAWQAFEEQRRGSLEPGKFADLVVLSENPMKAPMNIKDIKVLETIVGGNTVYMAGR